MVLSNSKEAVKEVTRVKNGEEAALKASHEFQNIESRLPRNSSAFLYLNLPETRRELSQTLAMWGLSGAAVLEPVLQVFPAMGMTAQMKKNIWDMESFTSADKDQLEDGLMRNSEKYQRHLLALRPEHFEVEAAGQSIQTEVLRLQDLFEGTGGVSLLLFNAFLQAKADQFFGDNTLIDEELAPILDGEYWLGFSPSDQDFAFILELDEGEEALAHNLLAKAVQSKKVSTKSLVTTQNLQGAQVEELKAEWHEITREELNFSGTPYTKLSANNQPVAFVLISENHLILSKEETTLLSILERISGEAPESSQAFMADLLPGSQQIFNLRWQDANLSLSRKIFDDGIYTRHSLQLNGN